MTTERPDKGRGTGGADPHAAGMPGEGAGQREEPGRTGVHPASAGWPEGDMKIVREGEWGQGDRGLAGEEDHGESEILPSSLEPSGNQPRSVISQPDSEQDSGGAPGSGPNAEDQPPRSSGAPRRDADARG